MKKQNNILLGLVMTLSFTACDDFLSIVPLNDVVLENFWTEEADVNSVVNSCYAQLENKDCINRMIAWGEMRSDNMIEGSGTPNEIQQLMKENLLETSSLTTWECFYQCINRCNTVIYYAPKVAAIDPNYTESEMKASIAEVTALRTLCHFYLLRAFRDVPYITEPSIDDGVTFVVPAMKQKELLGHLIEDLELVKNDAVRSYGEDNPENKSRITRMGIYALLADLYLWNDDYSNCVKYCDLIVDEKKKEYEEDLLETTGYLDVELYGQYPLISESPNGSNYAGTAPTEIFGDGLSFESLFELNFESQQKVENEAVAKLYGNSDNTSGQLAAPSFLFAEAVNGTNKYFAKTDYRFIEHMVEGSKSIDIQKYVFASVDFKTSSVTGGMPSISRSYRSSDYANWIIYRLTDVMLMKAEAEVMMVTNLQDTVQAGFSEDDKAHLMNAFSCVSATWKRANNKRLSKDTLVFSDYAGSRQSMEELVLLERQRELMFEGKRWFDLVRMCRRDGSNNRMIVSVLPKFKENTAAIRIKLASQDALYFPYNRSELKSNPLLEQNPAYKNTDTFEK